MPVLFEYDMGVGIFACLTKMWANPGSSFSTMRRTTSPTCQLKEASCNMMRISSKIRYTIYVTNAESCRCRILLPTSINLGSHLAASEVFQDSIVLADLIGRHAFKRSATSCDQSFTAAAAGIHHLQPAPPKIASKKAGVDQELYATRCSVHIGGQGLVRTNMCAGARAACTPGSWSPASLHSERC